MEGSIIEPIAATVAGPEPVSAAKINWIRLQFRVRPKPDRTFANWMQTFEIPPKSTLHQVSTKINSGTASSEGVKTVNQPLCDYQHTSSRCRDMPFGRKDCNATGMPKRLDQTILIQVTIPLLSSLLCRWYDHRNATNAWNIRGFRRLPRRNWYTIGTESAVLKLISGAVRKLFHAKHCSKR